MAVTSIVDYLKSQKQDSSYNARKQLAESNGITGYRGTAAQNTKLLQLLQSGSAADNAKPSENVTAGTGAQATTNSPTTTVQPTSTANKAWQSTFQPTELTNHYKNSMLENEDNFKASSTTNNYKKQLKKVENSKPGPYESAYENTINEILDTIKNRGQFDVKNDANYNALYDQYREQYQAQADRAMRDTLASANAATGGYGSTYGQAVAQQAYDTTMQGLNSNNMNLLSLAYQMYSDDRANDYNKLAAYQGQDNTMYDRYRDTVSDWQTDRDYYANQYQQNYANDRNAFENDRSYFANQYWNSFQNDRSGYENDRAFNYGVDQDALNREYQTTKDAQDRDDALYQNALQLATSLAGQGYSVPSYLTDVIDRYNQANGLSGGSAGQMAQIAAQALAQKKSTKSSGSSSGSKKSSGSSSSKSSGKSSNGLSSESGSKTTSGNIGTGTPLLTNTDSLYAFRTLQADTKAHKANASTGAIPPQVSNRYGTDWVYVEGMGRMTWSELESEINKGNVIESMNDGVYTYRKA